MTAPSAALREGKQCPECGARFGLEHKFCPLDGAALRGISYRPELDPLVGTILDGRYEVLAHLGVGGMGTVYKVRHVSIKRLFALKSLRSEHASDAELIERFEREARAAARARHPNIVEITDFGRLPSGAPYYVMELLLGQDLHSYQRAIGRLPAVEVVAIAGAVGDALAAAHGVGVVHRDLKPENIFLCGRLRPTDDVRVVDFGAAKIMGGSKLTRPGIVFGTPYYMAPEQADGSRVDHRADVYALGIVMYELLTGHVPFDAPTYLGILGQHIGEAPMPPSQRAPDAAIPPLLEAAVLKAIAKSPSDRFPHMDALVAAIGDAVPDSVPDLPPPKPSASSSPVFGQVSTADRIELSVTREIAEQARARRARRVAVGIGALAALTVASGVVAWRRNAAGTPAVAAAPPSASAAPSASAVVSASALASAPAPSFALAAPPSAAELVQPPLAPATASASASARPGQAAPRSASKARRGPDRAPASAPPRAAPPASAAPRARGVDDFADPWKSGNH